MGIAERQKRERKQRINAILDAASNVIEEHGIEGAKMEDIASAAELGKSTIYNYFASKQILLAALDLRGIIDNEEVGFQKAYDTGKNGLDKTVKICRFYFIYSMEHEVCFQAKVQIGRVSSENFELLMQDSIMQEYMAATKRINKILADAISDGIKDGTIRPELDPACTSLLLWSQSNGVIEIMQNRGEMIHNILGITIEQIENDFFRDLELQLAFKK